MFSAIVSLDRVSVKRSLRFKQSSRLNVVQAEGRKRGGKEGDGLEGGRGIDQWRPVDIWTGFYKVQGVWR